MGTMTVAFEDGTADLKKNKKKEVSRVLAAICAEAWLIERRALDSLIEIANRAHDRPEILEKRVGITGAGQMTVANGVAILPVRGHLFPRANMMTDISGATSLEMSQRDFLAADNDPDIKRIVMDYDTPGGAVT